MEEKRFKLPNEGLLNPLTKEGIKALVIVLAVIILIAVIAYFGLTRRSKKSPSILPAEVTQEEAATEPEPIEEPMVSPMEELLPVPEVSEELPEETPAAILGPTATESVFPD